jgi:hypothetical protein
MIAEGAGKTPRGDGAGRFRFRHRGDCWGAIRACGVHEIYLICAC